MSGLMDSLVLARSTICSNTNHKDPRWCCIQPQDIDAAVEEIAHLRRRVEEQSLELRGLLLKASAVKAQLEQTRRERAEANGLLDEMEASLTMAPHKTSGMAGIGYESLLAWQRTVLNKRKGK